VGGSSNDWYYTTKGQIAGPVSLNALQLLASTGQLLPTDSLRSATSSQSMPASELDGLSFPVAQPSFDFGSAAARKTKARSANPSNVRTSAKQLFAIAAVMGLSLAVLALIFQGLNILPTQTRMTKQEFRTTLSSMSGVGDNVINEAELFAKFGKPHRTQAFGSDAYWYYTCSDGTIQLVIWQYSNPGVEEQLGKGARVISQINDF